MLFLTFLQLKDGATQRSSEDKKNDQKKLSKISKTAKQISFKTSQLIRKCFIVKLPKTFNVIQTKLNGTFSFSPERRVRGQRDSVSFGVEETSDLCEVAASFDDVLHRRRLHQEGVPAGLLLHAVDALLIGTEMKTIMI